MALRCLAALLTAAALAAPATAPAQSDFPPQQIRIVVPFTAGGGTDSHHAHRRGPPRRGLEEHGAGR